MPTIFQVVMAGYWEKFSTSNNRASDKPHWLRYCHCAKLTAPSAPPTRPEAAPPPTSQRAGALPRAPHLRPRAPPAAAAPRSERRCVRGGARRSGAAAELERGVCREPAMLNMFPARRLPGGCRAIRPHHLRHHSVPSASPNLAFVPACLPPHPAEVEEMQRFISNSKKLFVMTGAGISTESGIPDYRSEGVGLYARSDRRPIQHAEFVRSATARQRYWARNFVGWPQFSSHQPNTAHLVLRHWEKLGKLHWLVTQNVDALHTKAGSQRMTELHGCTHRVFCLTCGDQTSRSELQEHFEALNPGWKAEALGVAPDGDAFLTDEQVRNFQVPACRKCGGILKPDVTFFGDTVSREKVDFVHQRLAESDSMLVAGSSMQVYSGYRFALAAREKQLPIAVLNIGPTRLDHFASLKLNSRCGELLPLIVAH
eukprot:XP_015130840.2 NAD-dependent protein lipoamidase sirtuin-4, mitochondrial isoform X4 [Gallus gallus]